MKRHITLFSFTFILIFLTPRLSAQLSVNINGSPPDASAMLDVFSPNKGFLAPRLSRDQILMIPDPANGLLVFCNTNKKYYVFLSGNNIWREISYGSSRITSCCYCGFDLVDDRDGRSYGTILIGNQCWMAQNLNVGIPVDGITVQQNDDAPDKHCYGDEEENCELFGGLYQWNEMMGYASGQGVQGICPIGWHLPSDAEWTTLITTLGGTEIAGGAMKSTDFWTIPNVGATNSSGFNAAGAGVRNTTGFDKILANTRFWTSTSSNETSAYMRELSYDAATVGRAGMPKLSSASVRCVMNNLTNK
jgi:uncharacterized protein (TIGR02145 family)